MKAARTTLFVIAALIIIIEAGWYFAEGFRDGFQRGFSPASFVQ